MFIQLFKFMGFAFSGVFRAFVYKGFLTDEECNHLVSLVSFFFSKKKLEFVKKKGNFFFLMVGIWNRRNRNWRDQLWRIIYLERVSWVMSERALECSFVKERFDLCWWNLLAECFYWCSLSFRLEDDKGIILANKMQLSWLLYVLMLIKEVSGAVERNFSLSVGNNSNRFRKIRSCENVNWETRWWRSMAFAAGKWFEFWVSFWLL